MGKGEEEQGVFRCYSSLSLSSFLSEVVLICLRLCATFFNVYRGRSLVLSSSRVLYHFFPVYYTNFIQHSTELWGFYINCAAASG